MFPFISLCKTCDPGVEHDFLPHCHNLIKPSRGPLSDGSYQISRLSPPEVSDKKALVFFPKIYFYLKNYQRGPYKVHFCQV